MKEEMGHLTLVIRKKLNLSIDILDEKQPRRFRE
jgi:hypothetical protein